MKKNLVFKLGLFCAALVLVATCFVTNAWAKYTTTVSATDTAKVAKWSVAFKAGDTTVSQNTEIELFKTEMSNIYPNDDDEYAENVHDGKALIAPGSTGTFVLEFSSSSQVAVSYVVALTENSTSIVIDEGDDAGTYTIPLKWSVTVSDQGGNEIASYTDEDSLEDCFAEVEAFTLQATDGTNANAKKLIVSITWRWEYSVSEAQDKIDTILGANEPTYTIGLNVTATQVLPENA